VLAKLSRRRTAPTLRLSIIASDLRLPLGGTVHNPPEIRQTVVNCVRALLSGKRMRVHAQVIDASRCPRYEVDACSWVVRRKGLVRRRRFDHVFASEWLKATSCEYVTAWREAGLSDHAAIEAVFER